MKNLNLVVQFRICYNSFSSRIAEKAVLYILTTPGIDRGGTASVMQGAAARGLISKPSVTINSHLTKQESPNYLVTNEEELIKELNFINIIEENIYAACNRLLNLTKFKHVFLTPLIIENNKNKNFKNLTNQQNPDGAFIETQGGDYIIHGATDCKAYINIKPSFVAQIILLSKNITNTVLINISWKQLLNLQIKSKSKIFLNVKDKSKIEQYIEEKKNLIKKLEMQEINQEEYLINSLKLKHDYFEVLQKNNLSEAAFLTDNLVNFTLINQNLKKDPELQEFLVAIEKDVRLSKGFQDLVKSNEKAAMAFEKDEVKLPAEFYEEIIKKLK